MISYTRQILSIVEKDLNSFLLILVILFVHLWTTNLVTSAAISDDNFSKLAQVSPIAPAW